jgi:hypothetical protein
MKTSEFLTQAMELAENTSLDQIWEDATGATWEENSGNYDSELALYFDGEKFFINDAILRMDSGWKSVFEQQNNVTFIGWVGDNDLINRSQVSELLEERIKIEEHLEWQNEEMKRQEQEYRKRENENP